MVDYLDNCWAGKLVNWKAGLLAIQLGKMTADWMDSC